MSKHVNDIHSSIIRLLFLNISFECHLFLLTHRRTHGSPGRRLAEQRSEGDACCNSS